MTIDFGIGKTIAIDLSNSIDCNRYGKIHVLHEHVIVIVIVTVIVIVIAIVIVVVVVIIIIVIVIVIIIRSHFGSSHFGSSRSHFGSSAILAEDHSTSFILVQ